MLELKRGRYFGSNKRSADLGDMLLTETTCGQQHVDWHYHEHPHFSYSLVGHCEEKTAKRSEVIIPGTLVYHDMQDAHCNVNHSAYSRNFYLELNLNWFSRLGIFHQPYEGNHYIKDPFIKSRINQIYYEITANESFVKISIDSLLVQVFDQLSHKDQLNEKKLPKWVKEVEAIIHEEFDESISLNRLASQVQIHPVHLSRDFPKYFNKNLGQYIRSIKIQQAAILLFQPLSLTEIAHRCGFSDQSHFNRCFKSVYQMTPKAFRQNFE